MKNNQSKNNWLLELSLYFSAGNETSFEDVKSFISNLLLQQKAGLLEQLEERIDKLEFDECCGGVCDIGEGFDKALSEVEEIIKKLKDEIL